MSTEYEAALHEARHVCAHWAVARPVEFAAIGVHAPEQGIVKSPPMANGAADLLTRVIAWGRDRDRPKGTLWPPPYEICSKPPTVGADPDGVIWSVRRYGLSRRAYEAVCQLAEELLDDEAFQAATELVACALMQAPALDRESLEILRRATRFADPLEVAA